MFKLHDDYTTFWFITFYVMTFEFYQFLKEFRKQITYKEDKNERKN